MAADGTVDVSAAVAQLDETIASLESEIETDESALGVKKARLNALRKGRKGLEAAVDPDLAPIRRPGRKKAEASA
jgi:hypothetical protein